MYRIIIMTKKTFIFLIFLFFLVTKSYSENITNIVINGNKRITNETIILFGDIKLNKNYTDTALNKIIKNLYSTDFFESISITISQNNLILTVIENPIIQTININGIKNKNILKILDENLTLKEKSSFVQNNVKKDETKLKNILKSNGYYFSKVVTKIKKNDNNTVDLNYYIDLGEKAFIENIKFIGDKIIKDSKLKKVIISEEAKFWKFISSRKFLDKKRIQIDENLLKNYYKNNGYYNVKVNSTFAQIVNDNNFELIFNIDAGKKYYFKNTNLEIPQSFDKNNFIEINETLKKLEGETYSLNRIKKILKQVDKIALSKQYEFLSASFNEKINDNNIDLSIKLKESEKSYIEKINILGNYITNENVIRNKLLTDEGEPFNEILFNKSVNAIKSTKIFSNVKTTIKDGKNPQSKVIDITVDEQPTGEIAAGAGTGTSGSSITFSIRENNYVGEGKRLNANVTVSDDKFTGLLSITDPHFKNTDKSLVTTVETTKDDLMGKFGYETSKTGFSLGTSFEQYQNIFFAPSISTYFESLDTSDKASSSKKRQAGDYFDTNFSYRLSLNLLDQNFQPTDGYKTSFYQSIPMIADDKSIENAYEFSKYLKIINDSVFSFKFFAKAVNNFEDDVRVSKRIFIPSRKLRGFASGKIGPKDAGDYIGGNYGSSLNMSSTLPKLFTDLQNIDFSVFFDSANLWGVDYDSSLDSSKIRSSTGLAIDWFTPIGPLSFSFAKPITKASTDKIETFRFQIGTTF